MTDTFDPSTIVWADPPEPAPRGGKYQPFLDLLKQHPGKWAIYPGTQSWTIPKALKAEGYTAVIRKADGELHCYVKWDDPNGKTEPDGGGTKRVSRK